MRRQAKVFTFILFLAILQDQVMANVRKDCRKKTGVSWDSLKKLKKGDLEQMDPKLKCYVKCFMVRNGIMNKNSEVDVENAVRHLPRKLQNASRKTLNTCKTIRGASSCDTAFQIAKCYFKAQPEVMQSVSLV